MSISRQESWVLEAAHVALGLHRPYESEPMLATSSAPAEKLGPTAQRVLKDTLAKGVVLSLARFGGWQHRAQGRLWERPLEALHFTQATVALLQWMVRNALGSGVAMQLAVPPKSPGDVLVLALALRHLADVQLAGTLAQQPGVRAEAVCWLVAPEVLALHGPAPKLDFTTPAATLALGGWSGLLASRWAAMETHARTITQAATLASLGDGQRAVLRALMQGCAPIERHGELTFVLEAAAPYLGPDARAEQWGERLSPDESLRDRHAARVASGAMLEAVVALRAWDQLHRSTRFIDDGYDLAQQLVRDWERFGHARFEKAAQILGELERPL